VSRVFPSGEEEAANRWAYLRDISPTGARLTSPRRCPVGTALTFSPLRGKEAVPLRVPARVVHSRQVDGIWSFGCELARPLSEAELRALVG
jgi:hypothetical protein